MAERRHLTTNIRTRRLHWLISFVAALVAMSFGSVSASATVTDHQRFTRSYEDVRWDCGYPMSVVGVETHNVLVRADKKLDGMSSSRTTTTTRKSGPRRTAGRSRWPVTRCQGRQG